MRIEDWKELIAKNKLNELFEELELFFSSTELENDILLMKSSYKNLAKDQIEGVITQEGFNIGCNKINKRLLSFFSEFEDEILKITSNSNKSNNVLEIIRSINKFKLETSTFDIIDELLKLAELFINVENVIKSINLDDFGVAKRQELVALIDKAIRRIMKGRMLVAEAYERNLIFYKSYANEIEKLISLLDMPKTKYCNEEVEVLKKLEVSLNVAFEYLEYKKTNSNINRKPIMTQIRNLKMLLVISNEKILSKKLEELKKEVQNLFDDIEKYNPLNVYKKEDLVRFHSEIKISLIEITSRDVYNKT